ncbi:MAG: hypothetical protein OEW04_09905 [Nitrospirota bacterium]|nr:hypothetical protein [Nitrospirota bacterium]
MVHLEKYANIRNREAGFEKGGADPEGRIRPHHISVDGKGAINHQMGKKPFYLVISPDKPAQQIIL